MRSRTYFRRTIITLGLGLAALPCLASERHFGFSYESPVLQSGQKELETYSDYRFGRDLYYSALDQRLEFEMGLGGGVQTSLYLNFTQEMLDDGTGNINNSFLADGISNEWKFKLMDNVVDDLGLGLYVENGFKPDEYELETKVILDKQMGEWLWTFNLTNEPEYHYTDRTTGFSLVPSLGFGYFIVPERFFLGMEARNLNFWYDTTQPLTTSILSAGPVLAYSGTDWWATLTFLPQVVNFQGPGLDLSSSERYQVQLGFSIALDSHSTSLVDSLPVPTEQNLGENPGGKKVLLKDLMAGKELYVNTCQRCHSIHNPGEFSTQQWERILEKMALKADIEDGAKDRILGYLVAFAKN